MRGDYPVVCVSWCDAYAYCKGVGKRLCGKIGGGAVDWSADYNSLLSQWYPSCSKQGVYTFPYDHYACNGSGKGYQAALPVGSLPTCQSYVGLFDMSGNVAEWEDSCEGSTGHSDECRSRGGSFIDSNYYLACDGVVRFTRSLRSGNLGFRCCSAP